MPPYVHRPEMALKRAEEFLDVGKRVRALEALTEAIKNRKPRIWQKSHEDIMKKFIQLCVELKQSQTAKEGLHQYKNLTASVNPKSLEDIIRYYLKLSEAKCNEAREKANVQAPIADVDDLDLAESPESMLLKVVSTDTSQDRADRVVLLPWVRFHWEAYRHCLDLLRNLSKLESLYHDIASQAFKFCALYVRKTELRKLCEMLRNHIGQISKREVMTPHAVNLNNPETQELNLRTRLVQLDHAISMEMWQEAFRAIEDVHGLMSMLKKVPKAALKANYFEKLALVFLRAGNAVFHAAAQHQLFSLYRNFRKDLNTEELRKLAVAVLFSTLAVPLQPPRTHLESLLEYDDTAATKMKQLTLLVGYTQPPTRAKLVEDLQKLGILQFIRPELQALYHNLEVAFDPLHMGSHVAGVLNFVNTNEELASVRHYVSVIEEVAVGKQLRQLSQVYDCLEIARVIQLMPYTNGHTIERVAIETARNTDLEVRIDHRGTGMFVFGSDVALAPYEAQTATETPTESQMPTDRVRSQLVMLLTSLTRTSRVIKSQQELNDESKVREQLFQLHRKTAAREQLANLARPQKADSRQKYIEEKERAKEQQAMAAKNSKEKESAAAENLRMQRDTRQFEEQRSRLKEKELEKQVIRDKIEKMKQTEFGMRVLKELDDLENVDVKELDRLEQRHREELKREEEENNQRLKIQEKKIDHTIRAKQLEELTLRKEDNARMVDTFKEIWLQEENRRIALMREERDFMIRKRDKMARMKQDHQTFMSSLQERKSKVYQEKMDAWKKLFEEQKQKRLEERRIYREEERRVTYERERQQAEEERAREEERRLREEEAEAKRIAEEEKIRKLQQMEAKQRESERRIEERLQAENESRYRTPRTAVAPPQLQRPAPENGGPAPWVRGEPLAAPLVPPVGGPRPDNVRGAEAGPRGNVEYRRPDRPASPPRDDGRDGRGSVPESRPGVYRPPMRTAVVDDGSRAPPDHQQQQQPPQGPRIIKLDRPLGGGGGGGGGSVRFQDRDPREQERNFGGSRGGYGGAGPEKVITRGPVEGSQEPTSSWRK
ncbi:Eukaryotic translation initiation factor 3 subunit A [Hypsibius exemplaris]|uniref:Eukaryotic translation initiation factor 3 subunit A n=1 Tax=Hypsibius exemplaris TaxID=2072580 RepID=A0A1W0W8L0_HYPEX|nr:Eukaryotic translation initiation factor 3 subunit A [Hypsibius exemplaris]